MSENLYDLDQGQLVARCENLETRLDTALADLAKYRTLVTALEAVADCADGFVNGDSRSHPGMVVLLASLEAVREQLGEMP